MKLSAWAWTIPVVGLAAVASLGLAGRADAARLENPVAEFAGIDKITGRITTFDVYVNETVQFGALQVTPKICYSRDEAEAQKIDAFIEIDEITLDRKIRRIFSGWMFADSPALNAVEHPIYDVWLTNCKASSEVPPPPGVEAVAKPAPEPAKAEAAAPATTTEPTEVPALGTDPAQATVPPLEAPREVPTENFGGPLPESDFPQEDDLVPQGEPLPAPAPVTPPPGVGLF